MSTYFFYGNFFLVVALSNLNITGHELFDVQISGQKFFCKLFTFLLVGQAGLLHQIGQVPRRISTAMFLNRRRRRPQRFARRVELIQLLQQRRAFTFYLLRQATPLRHDGGDLTSQF